MFRKNLILFRIAIKLFCILPLSLCYGQAKDLDASLATPVHDYTLTADGFAEGLLRIANQFQIPMGIEWISCPATRTRLSVSRADATVKEILQAVVETQPGYQLKV